MLAAKRIEQTQIVGRHPRRGCVEMLPPMVGVSGFSAVREKRTERHAQQPKYTHRDSDALEATERACSAEPACAANDQAGECGDSNRQTLDKLSHRPSDRLGKMNKHTG